MSEMVIWKILAINSAIKFINKIVTVNKTVNCRARKDARAYGQLYSVEQILAQFGTYGYILMHTYTYARTHLQKQWMRFAT